MLPMRIWKMDSFCSNSVINAHCDIGKSIFAFGDKLRLARSKRKNEPFNWCVTERIF